MQRSPLKLWQEKIHKKSANNFLHVTAKGGRLWLCQSYLTSHLPSLVSFAARENSVRLKELTPGAKKQVRIDRKLSSVLEEYELC